MIEIRRMIFSDVPAIASAFENSRWIIKEADLFEEYLSKQAAGLLDIWIACSDQQYGLCHSKLEITIFRISQKRHPLNYGSQCAA